MKLSEQESYQKLRRIFKYAEAFDHNQLIKEIESLHSARKSRGLSIKQVSGKMLADATMQDQAYRSRIVEISMQATKQYHLLEAAYESAVKRIGSDSSAFLINKGFRSIADRDSYVRSRLEFASARLVEINLVIELATMAIQDIDQAGWSMRRVFDTLQLNSAPERSI